MIVIEQKNQIIKKRPEDICTCILQKIKTDVETKLSQKVNKAVITVPAYFSMPQREATLKAAQMAGFDVLKLLNEPTAAALAFYHEKHDIPDGYSLVYDLGGGTFDVAILKLSALKSCNPSEDSVIEIIGVAGDSHLGGHDFDNLLVDYICDKLWNDYKYNPRGDRRAMRRIRNECEEAKKNLSFSEESLISLTAVIDQIPCLEMTVTRSEFEEMAQKLFQRTIDVVDGCLKKANIPKTDVEEVILAGGSTRIPKIQNMLSDFFDGKTLSHFINPDECVAEGAGVQAAMLSMAPSQKIEQFKITDVIPLSIGISNFVNLMTFLITKNTQIPVTASTTRISIYDQQTNMSFDIYEGERTDARKNRHLGQLQISDITPAPPGQCSVTVKMDVDKNGILSIRATETLSNKTKDLTIVYTRGFRNDSEIEQELQNAKDNALEDELFVAFAEEKGSLLRYCLRAKYNFENLNLINTYSDIYNSCGDILTAVNDMEMRDFDKVRNFKKELVKKVQPLIVKHNFKIMN